MTSTATQDTQTLEIMLRSAAAELSPSAVHALIAHPDAVRAALAATGALLARDATGESKQEKVEIIAAIEEPSRSPEEVSRIVEARTVPYEPDEELLNSNQVAARLGLKSRQSVHDWRRKGTILGWESAKRGYLFPARQFDERNRPLEGLADLYALFGDADRTWWWLTSPTNLLQDEEPLTLLARGERKAVIDAAEGELQGDFG